MNNKRFYRTFILFKNIHILQIQFNTHTNRAEKFEMSIIIKVHTVSIKIFRLLPRALISLSFTLFSSLFIFFFFLSYVVSFIFLGVGRIMLDPIFFLNIINKCSPGIDLVMIKRFSTIHTTF